MMTLQEEKVLEQMKHVLLQLKHHAHDQPIDEETGRNVDSLLANGAISLANARFIGGQGVRFYGFCSARIGNEIPVFETDLTTCRLTGMSDGSVHERRKQRALTFRRSEWLTPHGLVGPGITVEPAIAHLHVSAATGSRS